ncbi:MAG: GAF domain-containing protein [Spirochaetaceae bacterium]|nr:GAF domain-containing protein [Spirochaetaceae bacterium]
MRDDPLGVTSLSLRFAADELSACKDASQLAAVASRIVAERIPGARAVLYAHAPESREYRDLLREGSPSIPEDDLLVSFLAMRAGVVPMAELEAEPVLAADDLFDVVLRGGLGADYVAPAVQGYRLLGFLVVSLPADKGRRLCASETELLEALRGALAVGLRASSLVEERFRELLRLESFAERLKGYASFDELADAVLDAVATVVSYDRGVYYEFDEFSRSLRPRLARGMAAPASLAPGEGISGGVFERRRAASCASLSDHVHFSAINREAFIEGSFLAVPVVSSGHAFGVITLVRPGPGLAFSPDRQSALRVVAALLANELENRAIMERVDRSCFEMTRSVATAIEARYPLMCGHSERVRGYAAGVARELGLGRDTIRRLEYAAVLHDIGKVGVQDELIAKPDRLVDGELLAVRSHAEIGGSFLEEAGFEASVSACVKFHHERLDGSGYYGRKGGDYPYESMILGIADVYDALSSDRPYRKATSPEETLGLLAAAVGTSFDAKVFGALVRHLEGRGLVGAEAAAKALSRAGEAAQA